MEGGRTKVVVGVRGAFFSLGVFVWSGMRGLSEAINCVRVVNSGLDII